jgi:hypothetical protein
MPDDPAPTMSMNEQHGREGRLGQSQRLAFTGDGDHVPSAWPSTSTG